MSSHEMHYPIKMTLQECPLRHLNQKMMEDNSISRYLLSNILTCVSSIKKIS